MNPPSALHSAMSRDRKPFTYTPGGLDLSEIKSERMAARLMRNAMNQGVPELPPQHIQSPPMPSTPIAVPNFNCLPVQVFPTFNLPANPKSLLRTRSNPSQPREPPVKRVPPPQPSQFVNISRENGATQYDSINKNRSTDSQINNNRPTSMYEYGSLANTINYGSDGYTSAIPDNSYTAEYFQMPITFNTTTKSNNVIKSVAPPIENKKVSNDQRATITESASAEFTLPRFEPFNYQGYTTEDTLKSKVQNKDNFDPFLPDSTYKQNLDGKFTSEVKANDEIIKTTDVDSPVFKNSILNAENKEAVVDIVQEVPTEFYDPDVTITKQTEDPMGLNKEKKEVKVVKKQVVKKENEEQSGSGDQNGNTEVEAVIKLPTKKSAAKTETKVEVLKKTLPDGSIEEVKKTITKTTIDGRTEIKTKTETTIIPKEYDEEEEVEEEEENGENNEHEGEGEEIAFVVKMATEESKKPEENGQDNIIKTEEKSETTTTTSKRITVVQDDHDVPKEDEEVVEEEEEEIEEAEPVTVVVLKKTEEEPEQEEIVTESQQEEEIEQVESEEVKEDEVKAEKEETEEVESEEVIDQKGKEEQEESQECESEKVSDKNEKAEQEELEEVESEEDLDQKEKADQGETEELESEEVKEKKVEIKDITKEEKLKAESEEKDVEEEEEEEYHEIEENEPERELEEATSELVNESTEKKDDDKDTNDSKEDSEHQKSVEQTNEETKTSAPVESPKPDEEDEKQEQKQEITEEKQEVIIEKEELKVEKQEVPEVKYEPRVIKIETDSKPFREPSVPLEKVEDVEIKPIGAGDFITKTHTENTEIITNVSEKPTGLLTEINRIENIVTVNRTIKTLDSHDIVQQGAPIAKTYFSPYIEKVSPSPVSSPYQPQEPTERRHSLLLERLSVERQMPSEIYQNNYQYSNQTVEQQRQWSQEPQAEVVTVSNVKPSQITNQQWYQQRENNAFSNSPLSPQPAPSAPSWTQPKPPPQPVYQPQPQYQAPPTPQPQQQPQYQQPSYTENVQENQTSTYQNTFSSYTPQPASWSANNRPVSPMPTIVTPQQNQYNYLNKDSSESYQKTAQQFSPSSYVPPPWEQDSKYVAPEAPQNFYQPSTQTSTYTPAPTQSWKPTIPASKFSKPTPSSYIPPKPNQSFVKPVTNVEPPKLPGRKTYYSEYERRYISVPESTYVPGETKFQPQPDPSPKYYYDNNEPVETVEPQWRKELREFTEKTQTQTETNVRPPWEQEEKFAKAPDATYTSTPTWSQTVRPQSWRERSFESEFVSQEWPKTNTLGRGRPLSSYGRETITERARGVSVDRYNPNSYQAPIAAEHPPVQTHTHIAPAPLATGYHNPNVPAYHARASAEPREHVSYQQPRHMREARASPFQSRSFKYLQWITGTED